MAYFDNAATTYPKPGAVYEFMSEFYKSHGANAGRGSYPLAASSSRLVDETRKLVMDILECPAKQVVFTPSATIALNIIIQGLVKTGIRNVYISPFEHNAVTRVLNEYEGSGRIRVLQLYVSEELSYDLERIRYQFEENRPDLVIASHASNVIGLIAPTEEIFELAKRYGSYTVSDMSQTAGLVKSSAGMSTFDFAVFAGHKTLYGPTGISGFAMNPEIKLPAVLFGGTGTESARQDMPECLPERFEMGTLNILGIAGLNAALRWIREVGVGEIYSREQSNREKLIGILKEHPWIRMAGCREDRKYVGIVSCNIDGISSDSADPIFASRNIAVRTGLHCAPFAHRFLKTYPAGTIRFSVGYFTSEEDFKELREALDYIDGELS